MWTLATISLSLKVILLVSPTPKYKHAFIFTCIWPNPCCLSSINTYIRIHPVAGASLFGWKPTLPWWNSQKDVVTCRSCWFIECRTVSSVWYSVTKFSTIFSTNIAKFTQLILISHNYNIETTYIFFKQKKTLYQQPNIIVHCTYNIKELEITI